VSGSRGFYYNKCNDATRLAREWTAVGLGTWSIGYDNTIGKFYYRCTTNGVGTWDQLINKSILFGMPIEVYYLVRSDVAGGPRAGVQMKGGGDARADFDIGFHFHSGQIWLEATYATIAGWTSVVWPIIYAANTWYHVRVRFDKFMKAKIWNYGTTEPDWAMSSYYRIPMPVGALTYRSRVQKGYLSIMVNQSGGSVINADYSDIRITPIRKVGGP